MNEQKSEERAYSFRRTKHSLFLFQGASPCYMPSGIRHTTEGLHGVGGHILREVLWIGLESDRKTKGRVDLTQQVDQGSLLGHLDYRTIINEKIS
jgi:hypothetical protein